MRFLFVTIIALMFCFQADAQKTKSPYLEILSPDAVIPLQESRADVQIAGNIARVKITQVYHNQGEEPIEARYVFPLSVRAAVHRMQMRIGDRTVLAKIYERQEAEQVYQQALQDGKRAAKLDQERPNVFQMNVGNIMPGDEIAIELSYTEMLVPKEGSYQFIYPSVVGPRYTGEDESGSATFAQAYTGAETEASFRFDLDVTIQAGMIIQNISSPSHLLHVHHPDPRSAEIALNEENQNPGNRDFILNYCLRGNEIQSGLLLYEEGDEKFFAYMMEPVQEARIEQIPPREYLFIVDVSGSMNGYPLDVSKTLMRNLLCNLRNTDEFNILLFAGSSSTFKPQPVGATNENIEAAIRYLSNLEGGGGTNFINALNKAYQTPRSTKGSARSMVIITDGYISVEREAFERIGNHLGEANVYTFGIGTSVNRYLIEGMAKVAQSESFVATSRQEAEQVAEQFEKYIATPLLTRIQLSAEGFDIYDVEPASIPDVTAGRPVLVHGKWKGQPTGHLVVNAYAGSQAYHKKYNVSDGTLSKANEALKYLWARKKIERLDDYNLRFNADTKQEVIDLGLRYNLSTRFTSFVAVDPEVVNAGGDGKLVNQPLPMPQGVSDMAVGAEAEVKAETSFAKSFSLELHSEENKLTATEKRQLQLWFRAHYAQLSRELLIKHGAIRLYINEQGQIVKAEIEENGTWTVALDIHKAFTGIEAKNLTLSGRVWITLEQ